MSTNAAVFHNTRRPAATVALWALQIALAAVIGAAGASKLASATAMVQLFDAVGVGQWFRYVTGALEMTGAVLLLVPALAGLGALLLGGVLTGAVVAHLTVLHTSPLAPLLLLVGLAVVAYARRAQIAGSWATVRTRRKRRLSPNDAKGRSAEGF
jgi:putative oxidoreductase